ncbi:hypothetical protein [Natrinema salaciae]|uniref:Uncharacterized protein n=1 Tax=Natrinema salaciae TaxID=1186196 RepID=A0A1H9KAV7_9EURY|nr:hypothetical protein [Natrinema salaciae]SEQ96290.1 hypothetical protein SAMN04489841_2862 [Natrinema salaciae]
MSKYKQLLPEVTGTVVIVCYCFLVYWIVGGYLPIWSTGLLGIAAIPVVLWRTRPMRTSERIVYGVTRSVVVTLPAAIFLVLVSGLGRLIGLLRVFRTNPFDRLHPERHVQQATAVPVGDLTLPYSLLFGDYFTGEVTVAEKAFAALLFDPLVLLVAIESTVLFVLGGCLGSVLFAWQGR